ncbi:ABC transporter substrate-binding protein [Chitinophaga agri]|uniref:ABC transporter substrate-binding protein n=2 Tax=Chitinophaga agri TaxID=2703787 RepID=A0A6B9ZA97_9BACT|nr:ABC transporter substrate-binding protein [Chitinophaga agri]
MQTMKQYKDQLGREVVIPFPPRRIISVVPSQTELLFDLGLEAEVIGITKFCVHPEQWFRMKQRIGGTKQLQLEQILQLQPDLVIANKEENTAADIQYLMKHVPVWVSDIKNLNDALDMINCIGEITGTLQRAHEITHSISIKFSELLNQIKGTQKRPSAYFIWREPWMVAGGDTFINHLMGCCGLENVFAGTPRYPVVDIADLPATKCQLILLSSEPYPFKEQHITELSAVLPEAHILLVDGEMFSWYGSRLDKAADYLYRLWKDLCNCQ